jgi:hypothetical protein
MNKIIYLIFICFIISPFVSALSFNNYTFIVNKTVGQDYSLPLVIINNQNFVMYNISFENNTLLSMPSINLLAPGSALYINASIISDSVLSSNLRLRGYYLQNIGNSHQVYYSNITSGSFQPSICDLTVTKGDSINWINYYNTLDIQIINLDTNSLEGNIPANNGTYIKVLNTVGSFRYKLMYQGTPLFATSCTITVLDDNGYVNNPQYDSFINITILTNYASTSISSSFPATSYNINFYDTQQGVFTITNLGNQTAKNIKLSGDWISFNMNDIDLISGSTRGIVYTITPAITDSSQTNKSYQKQIKIEGNFPTVYQNLSIFVNYADIDSVNSSYSQAINMIDIMCKKFPELCQKQPTIVYKYLSNGSESVNVSVTQESLNQLFRVFLDSKDEQTTTVNYYKQTITEMNAKFEERDEMFKNISLNIMESKRQQEDTNQSILTTMIILFLCGLIVIIVIFIKYNQGKNKVNEIESFNI